MHIANTLQKPFYIVTNHHFKEDKVKSNKKTAYRNILWKHV